MADLIQIFHQFPPDDAINLSPVQYDRSIRSYLDTLSQVTEHSLVKAYETQPDILESLDPSENTLPYLKILISLINAHAEELKSVKTIPDAFHPGRPLWNSLVLFLERFDPVQVRYAGNEWRKIVEFVDSVAGILQQPRAAVGPLATAILRLDPESATLTSNHLRFIRLCLRSLEYRPAARILDSPILSFPLQSGNHEGLLPSSKHSFSNGYITVRSGLSDKLVVSEVQEYFLLGAMAYLGMRRYEDALLYLEHVLTTPTAGVATGLMVEAYKKWLLVRFLVKGKAEPTPKTMNGNALKVVRSASRAYETLGDLYLAAHDRLQAEVEAGATLWSEDGNLGLVQVFVDYHIITYVRSLANVYSAIPLSEVAPWIGMETAQTEAYLRTIIEGGLMNASIEGAGNENEAATTKVLRFYFDPTTGPLAKSEKERYAELIVQTQRTALLTEQVRAADHRLHLTKEYLDHVKKKAARGKQTGPGGEESGVEGSAWDPTNEPDEDMMADLH